MKKFFIAAIAALGILAALPAKAFCPVCTIAVAGGFGLSRWLGIDDTITGVWTGGLLLSVSLWTINWFNKKNINFFGKKTITIVFWYTITLLPLWWYGIIGHPLNVLWGVDKLIIGAIFGTAVFFGAHRLYEYLKKKNNGHAHFPLEKVAIPLASLTLISFVFFFITK